MFRSYRYGREENPGDEHAGEVLITILDDEEEFRLGLEGMAHHGYQEQDFAWVSELLRFKLGIE